jgi:hypothetical protein
MVRRLPPARSLLRSYDAHPAAPPELRVRFAGWLQRMQDRVRKAKRTDTPLVSSTFTSDEGQLLVRATWTAAHGWTVTFLEGQ